jgi:mRNA interferase MazF
MNDELNQGDILKIEHIKQPVLVVSKDFFNKTGEIIGCPVYKTGKPDALRIYIHSDDVDGYVHCEKLALLDLNVRSYSKICRIHISDIMEITDAIQSIFDYI